VTAKRGDDRARAARDAGWAATRAHPLFAPLAHWQPPHPDEDIPGWARIDSSGTIAVHPTRLATPQEWAWVFAHLLLHLGMGHHLVDRPDAAHRAAAEVVARRFQATLRFGTCPDGPLDLPPGDEDTLAARWREQGVPPEFADLAGLPCIEPTRSRRARDFPQLFAIGLSAAVTAAVDVAGGARETLTSTRPRVQPWDLARSWFVANYPLLAAVVSTLTIVADAELARGWDISVAAVAPAVGELYVNPHAGLTDDEWRFVIAHEALHAALGHHARGGGRHPDLFNIACDYVINGWLIEMGVGSPPDQVLYDPQFAGMSAEEVYDRIAREARRYRKLATLRRGGDILTEGLPTTPKDHVDLDALLRRALLNGLDLHTSQGRGLLPAALVEEIRALAHPPIGWDAALARWFDEHFPARIRARSYARPSRRSAATPDIPRPGFRHTDDRQERRTFGVVLDTSLSMDHGTLGRALGAIASYAAAHDVPAARVVFCDAHPYDAGYLQPEEIAGRVRVKGRGGTVLQPAVDLLERAGDFPADGPILVITDGWCDHLRIRREHAYLLPAAYTLPFVPKGPVFRIE
jgi:predicted metal-dependent peptidase